jgi:hypothetical protein
MHGENNLQKLFDRTLDNYMTKIIFNGSYYLICLFSNFVAILA